MTELFDFKLKPSYLRGWEIVKRTKNGYKIQKHQSWGMTTTYLSFNRIEEIIKHEP